MVVKNEVSQKYQNYLGFPIPIDNYCSRPLVRSCFQREFKYPSYSHSAEPCPDQAHEDLLDTIN